MGVVRPLLVLAVLGAQPCAAQGRGEQPNTLLGVTIGYLGSGPLWSVPNQRFSPSTNPGQFDTLALSRSLVYSITAGITGMYYPRSHIGLSGELTFLGLGTQSDCRAHGPTHSPETAQLCPSLAATTTSRAAMAISVGVNYRIASRRAVSPFVSARGGAMFAAASTLRMTGNYFIEDRLIEYPAFTDHGSSASSLYGVVSAGIEISAGLGYRFRIEARENYFRLAAPGGPSQPELGLYSRSSVGVHHLSVHIGIDMVLKAKPGRRY